MTTSQDTVTYSQKDFRGCLPTESGYCIHQWYTVTSGWKPAAAEPSTTCTVFWAR